MTSTESSKLLTLVAGELKVLEAHMGLRGGEVGLDKHTKQKTNKKIHLTLVNLNPGTCLVYYRCVRVVFRVEIHQTLFTVFFFSSVFIKELSVKYQDRKVSTLENLYPRNLPSLYMLCDSCI